MDERRLTVWRALSELFLDTELDTTAYARIAQVVAASGYSPDELQTILWNELFPVLQDNLRSVAGEWSGWPDEWLVQHIRVSGEGLRFETLTPVFPAQTAVPSPHGMGPVA